MMYNYFFLRGGGGGAEKKKKQDHTNVNTIYMTWYLSSVLELCL